MADKLLDTQVTLGAVSLDTSDTNWVKIETPLEAELALVCASVAASGGVTVGSTFVVDFVLRDGSVNIGIIQATLTTTLVKRLLAGTGTASYLCTVAFANGTPFLDLTGLRQHGGKNVSFYAGMDTNTAYPTNSSACRLDFAFQGKV